MENTYAQIAGRSVERLNALSDGLFAIAMTLIVLDIHVPPQGAVHTETQLLGALAARAPQFATYLMSFLTLGIFWVSMAAIVTLQLFFAVGPHFVVQRAKT